MASINLTSSASGRVHILGHGPVGGKGKGTLLLDQHADRLGYKVPRRSLIVTDGNIDQIFHEF